PLGLPVISRDAIYPDLHHFPTRRSSDLRRRARLRRRGARSGRRLAAVRFQPPVGRRGGDLRGRADRGAVVGHDDTATVTEVTLADRKSTRLNSSHVKISYAVFCLKKKRD